MSAPALSDHLLLEQCRQDNLQAYETLFDRYSPKLYSFGLKYISDRETVEELVMDLMLWVWQNRHSLAINTGFSNYMFRAMRNAVIGHLRKKVLLTTPLDVLQDTLNIAASPADQNLEYRETEHLYFKQLALLSPQRQKVFKMSREEDMTYKEIAKSTNLSVKTVENYMTASLAFFRRNLKEHADTVIALIIFMLLGR